MAGCILISDTQMASRRMLRFALQFKEAEIVECAGADETRALLETRPVELLLVGLYPREGDGFALLERLATRSLPPALPVILVGDTLLRAEYAARLWCGSAWLDRPFRVSELLSLVDGIFSRPPAEWTKRPE